MPRRVRELLDEGIYHVFNRGNDKMNLFLEHGDYVYFLKQWGRLKKELRFELYHYCLMSNHFHFLLKVNLGHDLVTLMHRVQLSYACYFKKKYDFVGHVFQERFRSPRIAEDSYYLQCGRYIERNPVKAGLVKEATDYLFSSASFYGLGISNELVTPNIFYLEMEENAERRQQQYREFLKMEEPYCGIIETALAKS